MDNSSDLNPKPPRNQAVFKRSNPDSKLFVPIIQSRSEMVGTKVIRKLHRQNTNPYSDRISEVKKQNTKNPQKDTEVLLGIKSSLCKREDSFLNMKESEAKNIGMNTDRRSKIFQRRQSPSLLTLRECSWSLNKRNNALGKSKNRVVMSSQKYVKINMQEIQLKKQKQYEQRISNMEQELSAYKQKYEKAIKVIENMEKFIHNQENKFNVKKQEFEEKIQFLKKQLSEKVPQCLPHIYTYKDLNERELQPDSVIMENQLESVQSSQQLNSQYFPTQISQIDKMVESFLPKSSSKKSNISHLSMESK